MLKLVKLAMRKVLRNKRRTALALFALVLGVGVMVLLRGFLNSGRAAFLENEIRGSLGAVQVHKKGYLANVLALPLTFDMADTPEVRRKLWTIRDVTGVAPRINFGAMISVPDAAAQARPEDQGRTAFFTATAIDPTLEKLVTPKRWELLVRNAVEGQTGALPVHRIGCLDNLDGAPLECRCPIRPS